MEEEKDKNTDKDANLINETDGLFNSFYSIDNQTQQIIVQKKDFIFSRLCKNKYRVVTKIENKNINIKKIIDFQITQLIYEINKDFFENIQLDVNYDNTQAYLCIMVRNLFEKFGFKQQCVSLHLTKFSPNESTFIFSGKKDVETIKKYIDPKKGNGFEIIPVEIFQITSQLRGQHSLDFIFDIELSNTARQITYIIEKAVGMQLKHVLLKTKKFIEALK